MTLQQIRYVLEISRSGSISGAAQALCLTQPYLSNILRDLENELHITIFTRDRKGVALTDTGKEFLQYARPLLDQEERILALYTHHVEQPVFRFSISTQRYPFIVKAFFQFFERYDPQVFEIHVRETSMDAVIRDVHEKQSDVGIIFLSTATESFIQKYLTLRNLEFNELITIDPCVFFSRNHPMAIHDEIDLNAMAQYPFASFETVTSVPIDFSEEALLLNLTAIKKRIYVVDRGTMINTLTHTDAFSIGTGILSEGFAGPELVSRPIRGHKKEIHLGWIQRANDKVSDEVAAFIQEVKRLLVSKQ
ncbi:LysR family transcriptional regulator [uncultured Dysosmobacter sp.]|uniref:LysR family transcriptional regulator n=1 Tax=uncultured Dysosmobacter sp. TaxID=2591384 RepID=UPI002622B29E|nr:LysR family transcriptional regulator [uncultured Dysosmobacter sp.]